MKYLAIYFFIFFLFSACAHIDPNDPLKNTKKLIQNGHSSLYNNGAFQVPSTKIKLIPEGPTPINLAIELSGTSAKASFLSALSEAKDSVKIVADGTKESFTIAKDAWDVAEQLSTKISKETRIRGVWIIENSSDLSKKIFGQTYELAPEVKKEMLIYSQSLSERGTLAGNSLSETLDKDSLDFKNNLIQETDKTSLKIKDNAREIWSEGQESFIQGYLALPKTLSENFNGTKKAATFKNYADKYEKSEDLRKKWSQDMSLMISGTLQEYPASTDASFSRVKNEFDTSNTDTLGLTFATVRAAGWVIQGLFWEGSLKPIGKLSAAGLGYIFINGLAYPAMITAHVGIETGNILVEITKEVGVSAIDIVAPTGRAAISTILSGAAWGAGTTTNAIGYSSAYLVRGASLATVPVLKYSVLGTSIGASKTIEYIGVPLAQAGIYTGGALSGVVTRGGGLIVSKTVDWGGQTLSATSSVVGGAVYATTAATGIAGSVGLGVLNGLYQVGKATVVPSAQVMGGAVVLSYGTLSQLSAHTILAAADASYLVLSMEGPSFVIYSIKGLVSKGDKLPTNVVLNLEELQKQGEIIKKIPATNEDIEKVLQQVEKEYGE